MTRAPRSASVIAAQEPTLPNPWTTAVAPFIVICNVSSARSARNTTPRPVASRRPSVPPDATGLPVTISVTVRPWYIE